MRIACSTLFASMALAASSAAAAAQAPSPAVAQAASFFPSDAAVRDFIRTYVDNGQARGIVVGLLEPDGTRRIISYGEAGEGVRPLDEHSVFEIGSITKTFTGAILADMVRWGEVSLDDPVQRYLPDGVRVPQRGGRQITLLDLATHTSGLPRLPTGYTPPDPTNPYADFQAEHLYRFLSGHELERDIGAEPLYSNLGMGLLGHVLARAAGAASFQALVEERILRPLGMNMTAYGRPAALAPWFTRGHDQEGDVVPYFDVAVLAGAGGLNSNVGDMLTYLEANIGAPATPLEQAMRAAHRGYRPGPAEGSQLGLAWMPRQRGSQTLLGHGGGTAGYSTYIAFDPAARAGVVVLTNSGGFDYADYIGRELLNPNWRTEVALTPDVLRSYVGSYRLREGLDLRITLENGRLFGQATNQPKLPLFAEAPDRLFFRAINGQLHFSRDEAGRVTEVTFHQGRRQLTGPRTE